MARCEDCRSDPPELLPTTQPVMVRSGKALLRRCAAAAEHSRAATRRVAGRWCGATCRHVHRLVPMVLAVATMASARREAAARSVDHVSVDHLGAGNAAAAMPVAASTSVALCRSRRRWGGTRRWPAATWLGGWSAGFADEGSAVTYFGPAKPSSRMFNAPSQASPSCARSHAHGEHGSARPPLAPVSMPQRLEVGCDPVAGRLIADGARQIGWPQVPQRTRCSPAGTPGWRRHWLSRPPRSPPAAARASSARSGRQVRDQAFAHHRARLLQKCGNPAR